MTDYGCKWSNVPHDFQPVGETSIIKVERCTICNLKESWKKGFKQRIDNVNYLKAHIRNFAQRGGATNRVFIRMYEPQKAIININL